MKKLANGDKTPVKEALKTLMCSTKQHREMRIVAAGRNETMKELVTHMWVIYKAHIKKEKQTVAQRWLQ